MGAQTTILGRLASWAHPIAPQSAEPSGKPSARASLPGVGVILNPKSHRNRDVAESLRARPGVTVVMPRTKPEIVETLRRFAEQKVGYLVIGGGDGTVRDVLTRAAPIFGDEWPMLIILPQGKTNALALDVGVPRKWSLDEALDAAARGRTVTRRPLIVEHRNGEARTRFGFILGAGVFNAAIAAGQVAHRFGAFQSFAVGVTAVFGVLTALFGIGTGPWRRRYGMTLVDADSGSSLPVSARGTADARYLAGLTTLTSFPLGIHPFPESDGVERIQYFIIDAPLRRAIAMFPFAMLGVESRLLDKVGMHRGSGRTFDIDLDDGFILDGEVFPGGSYRVRTGPEMRFVIP